MMRSLIILVVVSVCALARGEDAEPVLSPFDLPSDQPQQEDPDRIMLLPELGISISRAELDGMFTPVFVSCLAAEVFVSQHHWPTTRDELDSLAGTKDGDTFQKAMSLCHDLSLTVIGPDLHVRYLQKPDDPKSERHVVLKPGDSIDAIVTEALFKNEGEQARPDNAVTAPRSREVGLAWASSVRHV